MKKQVAVSIFGACVTRDVFTLLDKESIVLSSYIASQTMLSAVSRPEPVTIDDHPNLKNFDKKSVERDFSKTAFDILKNDDSEFLVIDLISERLKTICINNSLFTFAQTFMVTDLLTEPQFVHVETEMNRNGRNFFVYVDERKIPISDFLDDFAERILKIYPSSKVILHKVYLANFYRDEEHNIAAFAKGRQKINNKTNELLKYMYDYLEVCFENCFVIDESTHFFASVENRWKLTPYHYEADYNERRINRVFTPRDKA